MEKLKIDFYFVLTALLHIDLLLGLIHEWNVLFGVEIWVIWFLCHSAIYTMIVIYVELFTITTMFVRKNLLYHSFFLVLWYYQRMYSYNNQSLQSYEIGCKRDFLVLTTTTSFTVILLAFSAMFTWLIA